ncbi:MAG: arginine repressor, partial [Chlorobiales bacterium]|nr:arginine repressor [Chlorobiales bacterium]
MTKSERQLKLKELILRETLGSQHDLLMALKDSGIAVTQATLSRDCADLGVVRIPTMDGHKLTIPIDGEKHGIRSLIGVEILNVISNEVMVLVKTLTGRASGVASFIDGLESPEIGRA